MLNFDQKIYPDLSYLGSAERYVDDIVDNLDHIAFFQRFNLEEIKVLCHYLHCYAAPRGYILYEANQQSDFMIILLSGVVSIGHWDDQEILQGVNDFEEGITLGEASLVDKQLWSSTCLAKSPVDLAVLSRESLSAILFNYPRLGNKLLLTLMEMMALRLRHHTDTAFANFDRTLS